MGRGRITRKSNDPEDSRRVDEIEETFAPRSVRRHSSIPSVKQLRNTELVVIDDGSTRKLAIRIDGTLYGVTITAL